MFLIQDFNFEIVSSEDLDVVRNFFITTKQTLVQVPKPVMKTLKEIINKAEMRFVGPIALRNSLRNFQLTLSKETFESKMKLLSYALSDEKYAQMEKIRLVALDDGSFAEFDKTNPTVFIDSHDHPRSLLMPGYRGRFLNQALPHTICTKLISAVGESYSLFLHNLLSVNTK
jgi:sacsin